MLMHKLPRSSTRHQTTRHDTTRNRRGLMQLEIVVSAFLLAALISCMVGMNYRLLAVAKDTKHYQLALHEAANQIDLLTAGGLDDLDARLEKITLPEEVLQALPGGKINVQKIDDQSGTKVVVRIGWERPGEPALVELTGWVSTKEKRP